MKNNNSKYGFELNNRVKLKKGTTSWMLDNGYWMRPFFSLEEDYLDETLDGEIGTIEKFYKDCILVKLDNYCPTGIPKQFLELI